jgi:hypothetical protein
MVWQADCDNAVSDSFTACKYFKRACSRTPPRQQVKFACTHTQHQEFTTLSGIRKLCGTQIASIL